MRSLIVFTLALIVGASSHSINQEKDLHPDTGLSIPELIERHGYPVEVHKDVQTEDGYLLELHRIPHGRDNADATDRPVALLMHCLMCSSSVWVVYGEERGLAFILADLGYDVWMPNARGTKYSKKHISLDPVENEQEFWQFSWHQIGYYDLPASIDYILEQTGQEKLFYVGHSQGTTTFYVLASERPEYNDKIRLSVSLAPIGYMSNLTDELFQFLSPYIEPLEELFDMLEWFEFLPNLGFMDIISKFCMESGKEFCENLFLMFFGQNANIEEFFLPVLATHLPAGTSSKQWVHYGQEIKSGKFRQFDYGLVKNLEVYGQAEPPNYDTSKITAPVALFYSENDSKAAIVDVMQLAEEMQNVVHMHLVEDPKFTHVDFLFSENVVELLYDKVVQIMSEY